MKVLFFTHTDSLYGANRSMADLILELKEYHNVECAVMFFGSERYQRELNELGIESFPFKYHFWIKPYYYRSDIRWKNLPLFKIAREMYHLCRDFLLNTVYLSEIIKTVRRYQPDIIHCNSSVVDCGAVVANRLGIPYVWHFREFGREYNIKFSKPYSYVKSLFSKASRIIAVSESVKKEYQDKYKLDNITTVYNGIKPNKMIKKREPEGKIRFCCNGLLSAEKNQMEVLQAVKMLRDDKEVDFTVDFYGGASDTKYFAGLKRFVDENNLWEIVSFHGYDADVREKLQSYDVGIMPSRMEAFGRVTVEYMLSHMPVIGTDTGGTAEIILNDQTGFLYTPGEVSRLAECMREYIRNRAAVMKHGEAGYERAERCFRLRNTVEKVFDIYSDIMNQINGEMK